MNVMNELMAIADTNTVMQRNYDKLTRRYARAEQRAKEDQELLSSLPEREISFEAYALPDAPWIPIEKIEMTRIP